MSVPTPDVIPTDQISATLQAVIRQIEFANEYFLALARSVPDERWFEMPPGVPTHVAWQVGHVTVAQYGLLLFRVRGRTPEDLELIPGRFRKTYGKGTTPNRRTNRRWRI